MSASLPRLASATIVYEATPIIAKTSNGRVRGFGANGLYSFKGIPYGGKTDGRFRFMAAKQPEPWTGVRDSRWCGPLAVQSAQRDFAYTKMLDGCFDARLVNWDHDVLGTENCLNLNIWTPGLERDSRLPVMVWLHPGGYTGWSGTSPWTDGAAFAKKNEVVVVSLNHHLGVFGHLHLGDIGGPKYRDSANVGLLDIVQALTWVQENITAFGGDKDRVTIFGESGGAGKVCFLMAMPGAKGLFHRAIAQSGPIVRAAVSEESTKTTLEVLGRLEISQNDLRALEEVSAAKLHDARGSQFIGPVATGDALPRHPFDPDASDVSKNIPFMCGTTEDDMSYLLLNDHPLRPNTQEELAATLKTSGPFKLCRDSDIKDVASTDKLLHPSSSIRAQFIRICTEAMRDSEDVIAARRASAGHADTYVYRFCWQPHGYASEFGCCHTFEIPFVFQNLNHAPQLFEGGPHEEDWLLSEKMSACWAAFAREGQPKTSAVEDWVAYRVEDRRVMVFNNISRIQVDPSRSARNMLANTRHARLEGEHRRSLET